MAPYIPPIKERDTNQLLQIVDSPDDWEPNALKIASQELERRGFSLDKQKNRARSTSKYKRKVKNIKKSASYSYFQMFLLFIFAPFTLAWFIPSGMGIIELENEGYLKKRNQRFFLIILGCTIWIIVTLYILD